jgi:hypothetical protein
MGPASKYWRSRREALRLAKEAGEVRVWVQGDRYWVSAPANDEFMEQARQLGGKFRPRSGNAWVFPIHMRGPVNHLLNRIYGPDVIEYGMPLAWYQRSDR